MTTTNLRTDELSVSDIPTLLISGDSPMNVSSASARNKSESDNVDQSIDSQKSADESPKKIDFKASQADGDATPPAEPGENINA